MTKQEVREMTEQIQGSNQEKILVDEFHKEDWRRLLTLNYWEDYEDGKTFLRVN
jgi:hypothetical protein